VPGRPAGGTGAGREPRPAPTPGRGGVGGRGAPPPADGNLLALRGHFRHDHGAFTPSGLSLPQNATTNLLGPYVLPALKLEVSACLTNMVAATSTRGAGRPQGTFVMERIPDPIADTPGLARD